MREEGQKSRRRGSGIRSNLEEGAKGRHAQLVALVVEVTRKISESVVGCRGEAELWNFYFVLFLFSLLSMSRTI